MILILRSLTVYLQASDAAMFRCKLGNRRRRRRRGATVIATPHLATRFWLPLIPPQPIHPLRKFSSTTVCLLQLARKTVAMSLKQFWKPGSHQANHMTRQHTRAKILDQDCPSSPRSRCVYLSVCAGIKSRFLIHLFVCGRMVARCFFVVRLKPLL